jgi:hypothetical protein
MRLKVSPKAAVQAVDALVKAGTKTGQLLHSMYEKMEKDIEAEHEEYVTGAEEKRQSAIKAAESQPDTLEWAMPDGRKVSIPNPAKPFASLAVMQALIPPVPSFLGHDGFESKIAEPKMEALEQQYDDWFYETKELLEGIFMDFTPVHTFMDARGEFYSNPSPFGGSYGFAKYINVTRTLDAKIAVLIDFYKTLSEDIRSPLTYLIDQAKVCFYDFVCPMKVDSNEASLCAFMFQYSIGEKVEMEDIFTDGFGGNRDEYCGKDRTKIKNAYDGINRKTNEVFGFPILKKDGTTLCLTLPMTALSVDRTSAHFAQRW